MRKPINATQHNFIDYGAVAIFLLAPSVLALSGQAANLSYLAGVVHLVLTLSSDMPLGVAKLVKGKIHGYVELVAGPLLAVLPFLLGFTGVSRWFFLAMGAAIVAVWFFTHYRMSVVERARRATDSVKRY